MRNPGTVVSTLDRRGETQGRSIDGMRSTWIADGIMAGRPEDMGYMKGGSEGEGLECHHGRR